MIAKIYYIDIEKERQILEKMIANGSTKEKILRQSQRVDKAINKHLKELYIK